MHTKSCHAVLHNEIAVTKYKFVKTSSCITKTKNKTNIQNCYDIEHKNAACLDRKSNVKKLPNKKIVEKIVS